MFALQPEMKVFSGTANRELAERICKYIGAPLGQATISSFPDGETYVKIEENVRGRDVFLIQPTSPPSNEHLMELQQVQGFFDIPVDHLYSLPVLIKYLRQKLTGKTVVVSPDIGGLKMASAYAEALGANLAIVAKERKSATETEALYLIGEVKDHDVLLVDDLTETAGTLTSAAELLKRRGAKKIYAGVSHAVLVDVAIPRLQKSKIEELITTNSTPVRPVEGFKTTVLCVSELLGEGMKRIHNDESVSSLFKIDN